jgi:hypothetical protein
MFVVQALRASIDMMAQTNAAYNRFVPHEFLQLKVLMTQ